MSTTLERQLAAMVEQYEVRTARFETMFRAVEQGFPAARILYAGIAGAMGSEDDPDLQNFSTTDGEAAGIIQALFEASKNTMEDMKFLQMVAQTNLEVAE
jgi:hypothetical protein